jgi:hypothetical protein
MNISVLQSDKDSDPWIAVQWNNDLESLLDDSEYTAGVSKSFTRSPDDIIQKKTKTVTEKFTGESTQALVVELASVAAFAFTATSKATPTKGPAEPTSTSKKGRPKNAAKKKSGKKHSEEGGE